MSQVDGFVKGERNYANLRGDTGPLVSVFYYVLKLSVWGARIYDRT